MERIKGSDMKREKSEAIQIRTDDMSVRIPRWTGDTIILLFYSLCNLETP